MKIMKVKKLSKYPDLPNVTVTEILSILSNNKVTSIGDYVYHAKYMFLIVTYLLIIVRVFDVFRQSMIIIKY